MARPRHAAPLILAAALAASCGGDDKAKQAAKQETKKPAPAAPAPAESTGTGLDLASLRRNAPPRPTAPAPEPAKAPEPATPTAAAPAPAPAAAAAPAAAPAPAADKTPAPPPAPRKPEKPPPTSPDEISDTEVRMSWSQEEREALDELKPEDREKEMRKRRLEIFRQRGGVWEEPKKDAAAATSPTGERGPARPEAKSARDSAPPELRAILDDLASTDPETRARGAENAKHHPDKATVVRCIVPLLEDPDEDLRAIAASTLGAIKSTDAVGPLVTLVQKGTDKDQVRAVAIKALFDIGGREAVAGLRRIAREGEEGTDRAAALGMLIKLREVAEIRGLIERALDNLSAEVRLQAVTAIREFGFKEHEGKLIGLLKDSSELVQIEAMKTMGEFGSKSCVGALINVLVKTDEDAENPEQLQNAANAALEKITNVNQGLKPDDPDEKRAAAIDGWRIWWKKNKKSYE